MSILRMRRERGGRIARGWSLRGIFMMMHLRMGCREGVERDGWETWTLVFGWRILQMAKSAIVTLVAQSTYDLCPPGVWDGVDVIPSLPSLLAPNCMARY